MATHSKSKNFVAFITKGEKKKRQNTLTSTSHSAAACVCMKLRRWLIIGLKDQVIISCFRHPWYFIISFSTVQQRGKSASENKKPWGHLPLIARDRTLIAFVLVSHLVVCSKSSSALLSVCDFTCVHLVIASGVPCYDASHWTILRKWGNLATCWLGWPGGKGGKSHRSVKYTAYIFQHTVLLMPCYVVPPTRIRMFEVPHKDLVLWIWSCSYLSMEGSICSVFLVRWPVADPTTSPVPALPSVLTHKLSVGSSSIPRRSSIHTKRSSTLTEWVKPPPHLPWLSFLKSLHPSIPTLQS